MRLRTKFLLAFLLLGLLGIVGIITLAAQVHVTASQASANLERAKELKNNTAGLGIALSRYTSLVETLSSDLDLRSQAEKTKNIEILYSAIIKRLEEFPELFDHKKIAKKILYDRFIETHHFSKIISEKSSIFAQQQAQQILNDEFLPRIRDVHVQLYRIRFGINDTLHENLLEIQQKNKTSQKLALTVTLLLILSIFVLWIVIKQQVVNPLERITQVLSQLTRNETVEYIPYTGQQDEFGALSQAATSLNVYMNKNRNLTKELRFLNHDLEVKVRERTHSLEDALIQAQAAAKAKTEFLANMSHEIRTPLNAVIGFGDLLSDSELNPSQKQMLGTMQNSAQALLKLLEDVLDLSRIEADKVTLEEIPFDIKYLIEDVADSLQLLAHDKELELIIDVPHEIHGHVIGDPGRIRQVISNLITNAIKFTSTGHVKLSLKQIKNTNKTLLAHQNTYQIRVEDTGIGIAQTSQASIFDIFTQADSSTTRNFGGTGLGLTIVDRLLKAMNGQIYLSSLPEQGTTFSVNIPLTMDTTTAVSDNSGTIPELPQQHILLLDDLPANIDVYQGYLAKNGHHVIAATTIEQAKAALEKHGTAITMALLDQRLGPTEATGSELAKELKTIYPELLMTLFTSDARRGDGHRVTEYGLRGYLVKPMSADKLINALALVYHLKDDPEAPLVTRHLLAEWQRNEK